MIDFQEQDALWDQFLSVWPASRLATMTLDEYSKVGSKDTFTYWIESRLDKMGSVWGGSSFKFGVFSRKDTEDKKSDSKLSYSDSHGWYSSMGSTAEAAFDKVRGFVGQVANWAAEGNLEAIDTFEHLGEAFKWKIAFHYQNRLIPTIVGIFKRAPLAVFVGGTSNQNMSELQATTIAKRPANVGILEFGRQVWEAWSQKNLEIYKLSHGDVPSFTEVERQQYLNSQLAVMHRDTGKGQGVNFVTAPVGTLFFLCHGNSPQLIAQFTSTAFPCKKGNGWLQRSYRVIKPALRTDRYTANSKYWSPKGNSTFWQVSARDLPELETTLLKPYFSTDLAELATLAGESIDADSLADGGMPSTSRDRTIRSSNTVTTCFNRIYYGPPGTGKTYTLMQLLKRDYESRATLITKDELRAQIITEKISVLKWWEGVAAALHDLGGRATVPEIAEHPFIKAISTTKNRTRNIKQTLWGTLQHHTVDSSTTVNIKLRMGPSIFDKTVESVWHFAGDWEDACVDIISLVDQMNVGHQDEDLVQRYSFVTFHQSYGYEEFVEGLRPVLSDDGEVGEVEYEIRSGAFKELCRKARQSPEHRFAMVIDEINRGNISKIFGELITLIEPDKRDPLNGSKPPLELILAYSGEKFSVPANVDIIGSMNTADRSLALLDTALRRRFDFVPLLPDTRNEKDADDPHSAPLAGLNVTTKLGVIDVRRMLKRINERIEALYDRDHCLGHAYLTPLTQVDDGVARFEKLANIFRNRVVPLLEEYFFEDWRKIRLVLGDNQKPEAEQFITESDAHEHELSELFGNNHGLENNESKGRYQLHSSAFSNPAAYIGIYQSND